MSWVKTAAGRNACLSGGVIAACSSGFVKVYASDHTTLLFTINLQATAFGAPSSGAITANGLPFTITPSANGTAAIVDLCKSDNTVLGSGTVTAVGGGGDMTLDSTNVQTTSNITINAFTYTDPAN